MGIGGNHMRKTCGWDMRDRVRTEPKQRVEGARERHEIILAANIASESRGVKSIKLGKWLLKIHNSWGLEIVR